MLREVTYQDILYMLAGAIEIIRQRNDDLSRLDTLIGDGDHGVTMLRAMEQVDGVLRAHQEGEISVLLSEIGWTLLSIDGGAAGPLYGSFFLGMSDGITGKATLSGNDFAQMFEVGLAAIQQQTHARVGDKTLMDALTPAVQALRAAADQDQDIDAMMRFAASAAMQGSEATRSIPARYGRAKFQGERTIGQIDPGSMSMALIFTGFLNGLIKSRDVHLR